MVYPLARMAWVLAAERRHPGMSPDDTTMISMICRPWDVDTFLEMNNGRHLTLYDLGRFAHAKRIGLLGQLRARGWGFVVGGASVQFRRRVHAFQRIEMATRCLGCDEKWFYFEQVISRRGEACSAALLRTATVAGKRGTVPTEEVLAAIGFPGWTGNLPAWAMAWAEADRSRPWPPEAP